MRKIFLMAGCLLMTALAKAQFNTITFKPAVFTAEDNVTFTIDVSGSDVAGESELYIWTWCNKEADPANYPGKDGITNTDWNSAPAIAKMTQKTGNIFEFSFTGTSMYGLDPGKLKHFQFLIKTKNGSKKTADSPKFPFDPIVFIPSAYRVFPGKVGVSDMINLYFHQDLATNSDEQRMTPKTVTVTLYDQSDAVIGQPKTWNLLSEGNKVWSYSFIPNFAWTIPNNTTVKRFTWHFDGTGVDANGKPVPVTGTTNEKTIDALK